MDKQNAIEDLAFIKKIINESRQSVIYGWSFLIWGILVCIGLIVTYFSIESPALSSYNSWVWIGIMIIGWSFSGYESYSHSKIEKKQTFVDKITGTLWLSIGVAASIFGLVGMFTDAYNAAFISPMISTVIGSAYYVTGVLYRTNWLRNLSLGWWAGAILMFLWPTVYILLIMAFLMICFQIIPGFILQKQTKKFALENND